MGDKKMMELFALMFCGGMLVYGIGYFLGYQHGKRKWEGGSVACGIPDEEEVRKHIRDFGAPSEALRGVFPLPEEDTKEDLTPDYLNIEFIDRNNDYDRKIKDLSYLGDSGGFRYADTCTITFFGQKISFCCMGKKEAREKTRDFLFSKKSSLDYLIRLMDKVLPKEEIVIPYEGLKNAINKHKAMIEAFNTGMPIKMPESTDTAFPEIDYCYEVIKKFRKEDVELPAGTKLEFDRDFYENERANEEAAALAIQQYGKRGCTTGVILAFRADVIDDNGKKVTVRLAEWFLKVMPEYFKKIKEEGNERA